MDLEEFAFITFISMFTGDFPPHPPRSAQHLQLRGDWWWVHLDIEPEELSDNARVWPLQVFSTEKNIHQEFDSLIVPK